jgi:hypothetical protein
MSWRAERLGWTRSAGGTNREYTVRANSPSGIAAAFHVASAIFSSPDDQNRHVKSWAQVPFERITHRGPPRNSVTRATAGYDSYNPTATRPDDTHTQSFV